ncbi:hypothetical protein FRB96_005724 [Tulasnella sp. 330]|nr:hypothetical protein FRB96_005724 [Tulasnella sp. 330]KAG8869371.1 hypothetical protein FRB97_001302 [Tulasnella sp. 331]KAG8870583.1 hypothetical protein FRB98_001509 [Tulasnella sp. 332]
MAQGVKWNKKDAKAFALHIADITEKSIRRAVSLSDSGVVDDAPLHSVVRWRRGGCSSVFMYKGDRLKVAVFDTKTEPIVSLILPIADALVMAAHVGTGIPAITPSVALTTTAISAQGSKSNRLALNGSGTGRNLSTRPSPLTGAPLSTLVKAAVGTVYEAFKLANPMIPSPAGATVTLIIGVGQKIVAVIVDNVKSNPDKATSLNNKVHRLAQVIYRLLAHRTLDDHSASTEENLEDILKNIQSVRGIVNKQGDRDWLDQTVLASENAADLDDCTGRSMGYIDRWT